MAVQNSRSAALHHVAVAMTVTGFIGGIIALTATLVFAVDSAEESVENDQIVASFERAFNDRQPTAEVVTRFAIDDDVLYKTVNTVHWSTSVDHLDRLASDELKEKNDPNVLTGSDLLTARSDLSDDSAL